MLLITKQLFLLLKPKPALVKLERVQKAPVVSYAFKSLSNKALITFARKIIFCLDGNVQYLQTNTNTVLLFHSVIDMEDALMQYKTENNVLNYKNLKLKRMIVLHHLNHISNTVCETATLNAYADVFGIQNKRK